jgi:hypothetical protein
MANGAAETINALKVYPIFCVFHGPGLTQALVKEENIPGSCCADETEKAARVRKMTAQFVVGTEMPRKHVKCWSAWDAMGCAKFEPEWLAEFMAVRATNEMRRSLAQYNTGSISIESMLQIRGVCNWKKPQTVVEVGTFIGNSTAALKADVIFSCDKDNDCVPATERIRTFPFKTAGQMCDALIQENVKADLLFLDGRLTDEEVPLIKLVAAHDALWIFDDVHPGGKGEANIAKLSGLLPNYGFVPPYPAFKGRSTLAMLVPVTT